MRPSFFARPHWTRRRFFELVGGVSGAYLASPYLRAAEVNGARVETRNSARNVIFILLAGAPSHIDTFDFKAVPGVTPAAFKPEIIDGVTWPTGLMPKLSGEIPKMAIVRSMRAWALVHSLAQIWTQIGRSPISALGPVAPHIGSVVAMEKERERRPSQVFPTFLALNSNGASGSGYFPAQYAPFKVIPNRAGIGNTVNADGPVRLEERWSLLHTLDDALRVDSPLGRDVADYDKFYAAAKGLMYNPVVDQAFRFTPEDSVRYGNTGFGNACLVAWQVLKADQGTRFIQITEGGWDHHADIYNPTAAGALPRKAQLLDDGLATLLADLANSGLLDETLVVLCGEFGRTVGRLSGAGGRDHLLQQFCMFAGGGVKGGRAIGATNDAGSDVTDFGWSRGRHVRTEDIEATIYSALGIDWTTIRRDDPLGRGFEYVPFSGDDVYGPIHELWG